MSALFVVGAFVAALGVRLRGLFGLPPTAAEAVDAWTAAVLPLTSLDAGRTAAAIASAAAVAVLVAAFARRRGTDGVSLVAAVAALALLDPLGLVVGREAGGGAFLQLASALITGLIVAPPRARAGRLVIVLLAAVALLLALPADCATLAAVPSDPALAAWNSFLGPLAGVPLLLLHHLGYAIVPLAAAGLDRERAGRLAALAVAGVLLATAIDGGVPLRLSSFGAVGPPVIALAGLALGRVAEGVGTRFALPGLVLLIVAVNAPVLVSDLRASHRFPWPIALKKLPEGDGPIWTTQPAPLRLDTEREVRALPSDADALAALLDAGDATILIPVEGGRAWAADPPDLLAELESRRVADFEVRVRRFDLYRYELRAFIFPPAR